MALFLLFIGFVVVPVSLIVYGVAHRNDPGSPYRADSYMPSDQLNWPHAGPSNVLRQSHFHDPDRPDNPMRQP